MTDSKYFTTTKKGEIFELKSELNNDKKEKKKEAVKKVKSPLFRKFVLISACLGDRFDDGRQRRLCPVPRRRKLHANRQSRTEEARLPIPDELREIAARHGDNGREHVR